MKTKFTVLAAGAFAALFTAGAQAGRAPESHIGAYYIDVDYDDLGGDGFGVGGQFALGNGLFIPLEYNSVTLDEEVSGVAIDVDIDEIRAGLGYSFKATPAANVNLAVKYLDYDFGGDLDGSSDGFGLFVGLSGQIVPALTVYADLGYAMLDDEGVDVTGTEITAGAAFDFGGPGVFAEYRTTKYDPDDFEDYDVDQFRVGARFSF